MVRKLTAALFLLGFAAGFAHSNPYQGIRYETTTGKVYEHMSGELSLAASTTSWSTYTITLNGDGGVVTATTVSATTLLLPSSVSTATISGWLDIGAYNSVNACAGSATCRAGCGAGVRSIGGGCTNDTGQALYKSFPSTNVDDSTSVGTAPTDGAVTYSWSCTAASAVGTTTAYAICARIK